jgi:cysteine synthase A
MPEGMSEERKKMMRAFGAKLVLTLGSESDGDLCIKKIKQIKQKNPNTYWQPSQFDNSQNIDAHYQTTGPEIWEQTKGKIDGFVASQGTGGTLTGIGRFLKDQNPNISIYAVEPAEAPLLTKQKWGSHKIQGIGDGFLPSNLDLSLLRGIITTTSKQSIDMAKKLALKEGLFCGISSGCNVAAVIKLAKKHPELKRIVTIINDSGQRYFSTELFKESKQIVIPQRNHPLNDHEKSQIDMYKPNWEIIE